MLYGCPFEKITFLHKIDTNSGFGRDWDTLWTKTSNDILITLQMKVFGGSGIWPQKFSNSMHGIKSAKLAISKVALLILCMEFEIFCGQILSFEVLWVCHY